MLSFSALCFQGMGEIVLSKFLVSALQEPVSPVPEPHGVYRCRAFGFYIAGFGCRNPKPAPGTSNPKPLKTLKP